MNDADNDNGPRSGEALPWPTDISMADFTPPTSIDDLPDAFFTVEVKCPDTGNVLRLTNAPSRAERRRLERQFKKRKARRLTARKP